MTWYQPACMTETSRRRQKPLAKTRGPPEQREWHLSYLMDFPQTCWNNWMMEFGAAAGLGQIGEINMKCAPSRVKERKGAGFRSRHHHVTPCWDNT